MSRAPRFQPLDEPDRFARHALIPGWDQERLERARFVVVGAGALGNEVLKNLALAGVRQVVIVDADTVATSNLSRSVLFRAQDAGQPKAEVAARAYAELLPGATPEALVGDLHHVLGPGFLAGADGILGCLDSLDARLGLSRLARRAGVPFWNGGLGVAAAEVTHFGPGDGPCFGCTLDQRARERELARWSCQNGRPLGLPDGAVPTTAVSASLGGALLVQEALASLFPTFRERALLPGEKLFLNASPGGATRFALGRSPDCPEHAVESLTTHHLETLDASASAHEVAEALGLTPASLELHLGHDVVVRWTCSCAAPPLPRPIRLATACPACGHAPEAYETVASLAADGPWSRHPLSALGVPPGGEVLGFRDGEAFLIRLSVRARRPETTLENGSWN